MNYNSLVPNPPYVSIGQLDEAEKARYRQTFRTAEGRFDLYLLFFERALDLLAPGGRLVFITPEKWQYVDAAAPLRRLLQEPGLHVESITHLPEDTFDGFVTFPCVTTVRRTQRTTGGAAQRPRTRIRLRDETTHNVRLPDHSGSWAAAIRGADLAAMDTGATLGDITVRISAGVATGADGVFAMHAEAVPETIDEQWIRPTVSGRELTACDGPHGPSVWLCPYRDDGSLAPRDALGTFGDWAAQHRERLEERFCVQRSGKPWYAWHETPPMRDLRQPKILFQDITQAPRFWLDATGDVVPRHSVYYLVPQSHVPSGDLLAYLNSPDARRWMEAHGQRAANGFLRLQSRVLQRLPVPAAWKRVHQTTLAL